MPRRGACGEHHIREAHKDHPDNNGDCAPASYFQLPTEAYSGYVSHPQRPSSPVLHIPSEYLHDATGHGKQHDTEPEPRSTALHHRPRISVQQRHEVSRQCSASQAVVTHSRQYLGRGTRPEAARGMLRPLSPFLRILLDQSTRPTP
jgi:hypothetical protein